MNNFFKDSVTLIKNYKWNSMFFRYFKALIFVIIVPAIIFIAITFYSFLSATKDEIAQSQRFDLIKSITQFDKAYDTIDSISDTILNSSLTPQLILSDSAELNISKIYSDFLISEKQNYPYINSISVYNSNTGYVTSTYGSNYTDNFRDISWLTPYNGGYADFSVTASPRDISDSPQFNVCRNLLINGKNEGIIIFTLDGDVLCEQMYTGDKNQQESVLIFDEKDVLLYSSNKNAYSSAENEIAEMLKNTTYKEESTLENADFLYNAIASENHQFKLVSALSNTAYNKNFSKITYITIIYFLITLLLVIIFSLIVAFSFYRSIVDIVLKTSSISTDIGVNMEEENNELMYLSDTLFNTIKNHQQIENELVEKVSKLKKVQSIALQTQINPHFLFNTLNLVNGFILEECRGESKAATMLSNLSDILYIALNTKEYIVSVENEFEYAKKYLAIEQTKYPNKFLVKYEIDPETLDCKTVKFVLQPIIENAIEHGIKKITGKKGIIKISSSILNNKLVLSVSDNGPKIPDNKLSELEHRLESDEIQETKHIGLSNVNQRIKLIFGNEYGINIFSDDYETVIDIVMPVR